MFIKAEKRIETWQRDEQSLLSLEALHQTQNTSPYHLQANTPMGYESDGLDKYVRHFQLTSSKLF